MKSGGPSKRLIQAQCGVGGAIMRPIPRVKRTRRPSEEAIRKLREAPVLLAGGQGCEAVCKTPEVSPPICQGWWQEDGGARGQTVKRTKELE